MAKNLKQTLIDGQVAIGTFLFELSKPSIPRILADAGFDFLVIDSEHGTYTLDSAAGLIASSLMVDIVPLVRVPEITRTNVLRPLELGAGGILAPMIRDQTDVERLYALSKYPPQGERGTCLGTAHTNYRLPDAGSYLQKANEEILLVGQIETKEALANIDAILGTGKLDVAFVGPLDLSVSLGKPGRQNTTQVEAAIDLIWDRCGAHKVVPGAFAADADAGKRLIERGFRMIACSGELFMLAEKAKQIVEDLRGG